MGKKILLADDSITIQKVIELTFSDEDFEVVTVGNGRIAIERLRDVRPDLVLCDIIMPEKDGYEVCEFIKKDPSLSHIPVLLLTGAFEPFDQERSARVGCDGFLAKPFEPQTLIAKVKELLARSNPAAASAAPGPAKSADTSTATSTATSAFAPPPAPPWSTAMPSSPPPAAPEPEPPAKDAAAFGADTTGRSAFGSDADIGTVRAPAFRATEADRYAVPPASLDELYDDDPYGAANDLMPLGEDEAESVSPAPAKPEDAPWPDENPVSPRRDEPAPWAQPTVAVPLETLAQAGAQSAPMPADGFEEVFDGEAPAPPTVERGFGFVRQEDALASPASPAAPSPAAPPAVKKGFGRPDSSFRDVAPAEEEEQTPISRSVAGEVQVPVDMVEKIAQRVVAQISEKVIREIAWEVIPDLAEALIKREIDRLKAELQQT